MSIETVFNLGEDAFSNLFDLVISRVPSAVPVPAGFDLEREKPRITNFSVPSSGWESYEIDYKTESFSRVSAKVDLSKEITFDIRVDRNYKMYKFFVNWKNAVLNSYTGAMGTDDSMDNGLRTSMSVWAIEAGAEGTPIPGTTWKFEGVICKSVPEISFDYGSSDPITVSITLEFLRMNDNELA